MTDDRDTGPFFAAAREGRLDYCACEPCGRGIHPPAAYCPHCGERTSWKTASGRGKVYAFGEVHHTVNAAFPAPYTVVLVELADQPDVRLVGHMAGLARIEVGEEMEVFFQDAGEGVVLPQWRPSGAKIS
ncbi:Zn-ribbon domain-containing OB-fold protein [Sphingomonas tabacisoli]|uniref:Zn-ribbon domain-containing OB-fold protein n=1 Tax=Sphingomonas tabacisoli TaxID=2249466 RepID=A0ABW4I0L9_9SPHN